MHTRQTLVNLSPVYNNKKKLSSSGKQVFGTVELRQNQLVLLKEGKTISARRQSISIKVPLFNKDKIN